MYLGFYPNQFNCVCLFTCGSFPLHFYGSCYFASILFFGTDMCTSPLYSCDIWVEPYCFSWNCQCMSEHHYAPVMSSITCLSMYCSFLISYLFGFAQKGYAIHQWHNNMWFSHRQAFFSPAAIECFFFSSLLSSMNAYAKSGFLLT